MKLIIALTLVAAGAFAQKDEQYVAPEDYGLDPNFQCPDAYGDFEAEFFCDLYWRCERNEPKLRKCSDGLAFRPTLRGLIDPCDYTFSTDCTGRENLQDPSPGPDAVCERKNGIFPHEYNCGGYYICKQGQATEMECGTGLHLSLDNMECVWPNVAKRVSCDTPIKEGNFTCPPDATDGFDALGNRIINPTYIHPDDCRFFYVCLNGINPELRGCPEGTVFNDIISQCDDPLSVSGCENYYGEA